MENNTQRQEAYGKLSVELSQLIPKHKVKALIACNKDIKPGDASEITDFLDHFGILEQRCLLSETNVDKLLADLTTANLTEAAEKVREYRTKYLSDSPGLWQENETDQPDTSSFSGDWKKKIEVATASIKTNKYTSKNGGLSVIISNSRFPELGDLLGYEQDVPNLLSSLGEVNIKKKFVQKNLKAQEMIDFVQCIIDELKREKYDFLIMFVLSHGLDDVVCGINGGTVSLSKDIINPIGEVDKMKGKPKLFLVQACRGGGKDPGMNVAAAGTGDYRLLNLIPKNDKISPTGSDILVCYAGTEGFMTFVVNPFGSIFCTVLADAFRENAVTTNILTVLTGVLDIIAALDIPLTEVDGSTTNVKQMPQIISTLRKKFIFPKKMDNV